VFDGRLRDFLRAPDIVSIEHPFDVMSSPLLMKPSPDPANEVGDMVFLLVDYERM